MRHEEVSMKQKHHVRCSNVTQDVCLKVDLRILKIIFIVRRHTRVQGAKKTRNAS